MKEKKTIWLCKYKLRVWKEVYSNKTKSTKLSHLYTDYEIQGLLKGNCPNDFINQELNSYTFNSLKEFYSGKYSCNLKIIGEVKRLSSHGRTNNEI